MIDFNDVKLIHTVQADLRVYCESNILPRYSELFDSLDENQTTSAINYALNLAETLYVDMDVVYLSSIFYSISNKLDTTVARYDITQIIGSFAQLLDYFDEEQLQMISTSCHEAEEYVNTKNYNIDFISIYAKILIDADIMTDLDYKLIIGKTWANSFNSANTNKEVLDLITSVIVSKSKDIKKNDGGLLLANSKKMYDDSLDSSLKVLSSPYEIEVVIREMLRYSIIESKNDDSLGKLDSSNQFEEDLNLDMNTLFFFSENYKNDIKLDHYTEEPSLSDYLYNTNKDKFESFNEAVSPTKRKEIEKMVYDTLNMVDKSGLNAIEYKKFFSKMSDTQFSSYMTKFINNVDENFYIEILPNKNEPKLKDITNALKSLNIPVEEYVYYKHDGNVEDPIRTAYPVPVGPLTVRRVQQTLSKKNTYSLDTSKRNMKTGCNWLSTIAI